MWRNLVLATTRDNNSGTRAMRTSSGARTNLLNPFETEKDSTCATWVTKTSNWLGNISERTRTPRATIILLPLGRISGNWYLFQMTNQRKLFNICPKAIVYIIPPMIGFRTCLIEDNPNIRHILQANGSKLARPTGTIGVNRNLIKELGKLWMNNYCQWENFGKSRKIH